MYKTQPKKRKFTPKKRAPKSSAILINKKPEIKTVDVELTDTNKIDLSEQLFLLNGVEEGTSFYNRIGRKIAMKSLRFRATYKPSEETDTNLTETHRILIFYDRQPNGVAPIYSDIIKAYSKTGTQGSSLLGNLNMNNVDRFTVLMDIQNLLADDSTLVGLPSRQHSYVDYKHVETNIDRYIKLKGLETQFKLSTGEVASIATGALYMLVVGDNPEKGGYKLQFTSRLRYYDN